MNLLCCMIFRHYYIVKFSDATKNSDLTRSGPIGMLTYPLRILFQLLLAASFLMMQVIAPPGNFFMDKYF